GQWLYLLQRWAPGGKPGTDSLPCYGIADQKEHSSMKPRALVTGGAGFLGSHLCDALLAEGYSVVAVDNLLTGRMSNIEHLRREGNFEFLQIDITPPFDW